MATINIVTTAEQDAALQILTDRYNIAFKTELTPEQWLVDIVLASAFQSYVVQVRKEDSEIVKEAWDSATLTIKSQIKTLLGISTIQEVVK